MITASELSRATPEVRIYEPYEIRIDIVTRLTKFGAWKYCVSDVPCVLCGNNAVVFAYVMPRVTLCQRCKRAVTPKTYKLFGSDYSMRNDIDEIYEKISTLPIAINASLQVINAMLLTCTLIRYTPVDQDEVCVCGGACSCRRCDICASTTVITRYYWSKPHQIYNVYFCDMCYDISTAFTRTMAMHTTLMSLAALIIGHPDVAKYMISYIHALAVDRIHAMIQS